MQELKDYRPQRMNEEGERLEWFEQNICIYCEELGVKAKKVFEAIAFNREREDCRSESNGREAVTLRDSYECAFVGNTKYKDICKTYKIKL